MVRLRPTQRFHEGPMSRGCHVFRWGLATVPSCIGPSCVLVDMGNINLKIFREAFDYLPVPALIAIKVNGEFLLELFNFKLIGLTKTGIVNYYNKSADKTFAHRPDILEKFYLAYNNRSIEKLITPYRLLTTGADVFFKISFVYLEENIMFVIVIDITEEHKSKMMMAEIIYNTLSLNEKDVLFYMVRGLTRQDIANGMGVRLNTVYSYIERIREKSGGNLGVMVDYEKQRQAEAGIKNDKYSMNK